MLSASAKSLVLEMADGTKIYYLLGGEVNPKMTINDGEVYVNMDKYMFANIAKFYISDTDDPALAIDDVQSDASLTFKDGKIFMQTAGPVRIYTADGRLVDTKVTTMGTLQTVDANSLETGTYILRVNGKSVKFMKK